VDWNSFEKTGKSVKVARRICATISSDCNGPLLVAAARNDCRCCTQPQRFGHRRKEFAAILFLDRWLVGADWRDHFRWLFVQ
jgi:hypothetical protein